MQRFKLTIEYDGTPYVGWQRQANGLGVQQVIEESVEKFSGETVSLQVAGRTDTGVHATGQVAHLDLHKPTRADRVRDGLNFHLKGHSVSILQVDLVDEDFKARFSATKRYYLYRILNRRSPPVLQAGRVWHVIRPLNDRLMHEASKTLLGKHDFTTFRASECQAQSPVRTLDGLEVSRTGEIISVKAEARSFLHSQIRSLVGSLKLVGEGKWTTDDLRSALDACDRKRCGALAPASGLYLTKVDYP